MPAASTGSQGIVIAESHNVDVILLDINLPNIDGYEVVGRLRLSENPALVRVPIITVTTNTLKGDMQKAIEAGCTTYRQSPLIFRA